MNRPTAVTDEHLEYLDELRESGEINMYGAAIYLQDEFGTDKKEADKIVDYWMKSFGDDGR